MFFRLDQKFLSYVLYITGEPLKYGLSSKTMATDAFLIAEPTKRRFPSFRFHVARVTRRSDILAKEKLINETVASGRRKMRL